MTVKENSSKGLQARKSENTRETILNAAIECIFKLGYARTSTKIIADQAKVSRGAMIHHFPTKADLLVAVVEHLTELRIKHFTKQVAKLKTAKERESFGLDLYWKQLKTKLYMVYHELTVASRTDAMLGKVMKKGTLRFEDRWNEAIRALFPEWDGAGELLDLANDLVQFSYEGMVLNHLSHDDNQRRERVRTYIKARVSELLRAADAGDLDAAMLKFVKDSKVS
ncbi:MAG: AcrR family transcriptional regulator [Arenicella sp.]|jgi:AcrR family transcriptional regulator